MEWETRKRGKKCGGKGKKKEERGKVNANGAKYTGKNGA
jgi:hypothetical protein